MATKNSMIVPCSVQQRDQGHTIAWCNKTPARDRLAQPRAGVLLHPNSYEAEAWIDEKIPLNR